MRNLLHLHHVKKYFSSHGQLFGLKSETVKAVDDVSFFIAEGETVSIAGESGCGKTTLARLIFRLYDCDEGQMVFDGQDMTSIRGKALRQLRQHIQMVFQDPYSSLDPRFTVRQIMEEPMGLAPQRFPNKKLKEARVIELLEAVGLNAAMMRRYPHEFSGGERQRIAIARALVINPKLLILDEAVSSLDVIIQKQILDLLKNVQKQFKLSFIFITHNLRVARYMSDRIVVMRSGKVIEEASTEQLFCHPAQEYTRQLLKAAVNYETS